MLFIVAIFAVIAFIDLKPVLKQHSAGILTTFIILFTGALTLAVLQNYNIEVPSSFNIIGNLIKLMGLSYK